MHIHNNNKYNNMTTTATAATNMRSCICTHTYTYVTYIHTHIHMYSYIYFQHHRKCIIKYLHSLVRRQFIVKWNCCCRRQFHIYIHIYLCVRALACVFANVCVGVKAKYCKRRGKVNLAQSQLFVQDLQISYHPKSMHNFEHYFGVKYCATLHILWRYILVLAYFQEIIFITFLSFFSIANGT